MEKLKLGRYTILIRTHDQTTNNSQEQLQKQPLEVFCKKKGVLRNFTNFTAKHLCQSLFIKKETVAQVFSL